MPTSYIKVIRYNPIIFSSLSAIVINLCVKRMGLGHFNGMAHTVATHTHKFTLVIMMVLGQGQTEAENHRVDQ